MQYRVTWHLLIIVEHQYTASGQARAELLKKPPREGRQPQCILRSQSRQRCSESWRKRLCTEAEEVKESGRVCVGFIEPIPTDRQTPRLQIAGYQRGLSRSGRRGDPGQRTFPSVVEKLKEPWPLEHRRQRRRRKFRQPERLSLSSLSHSYPTPRSSRRA